MQVFGLTVPDDQLNKEGKEDVQHPVSGAAGATDTVQGLQRDIGNFRDHGAGAQTVELDRSRTQIGTTDQCLDAATALPRM